MREEITGFHKAETVERVYINYHPKITFQLKKIFYLTINIRISRHWQSLYVSLVRLKITSINNKEKNIMEV